MNNQIDDQAAGLRKRAKQKFRGEGSKEGLASHKTRIICIASGKGGVGKSNITLNLGLALQDMEEKVLLIDGDMGMANLDILLGLTPRYNLGHIIKGECSYEEALMYGPDNLSILPGTSGAEDFVNISYEEVIRLLECSSQMEADYDIIIIDIGAGAHESVINFIGAADEALIVVTPEPTSIMDAYSLIKILADNHLHMKLGLLLNQVENNREADKIADRIKTAVGKYLELDLDLRGIIPYDNHIKKSVKKQRAVIEMYPNSRAGQAILKTASSLIDRKQNNPSRGLKGFVYRIVGMFGRGNSQDD